MDRTLDALHDILTDGTKPPSKRIDAAVSVIESVANRASALEEIRAIFSEPVPRGYVFHDDLDRIAAILQRLT